MRVRLGRLSRGLRLLVVVAVVGSIAVGPAEAVDRDEERGVSFSSASKYATVVEGELTLRFDGLTDRATTSAHEAFTVHAEARRDLWIEHDLEGVTFYANGSPERVIDASNPFRLGAGDSRTIGVEIDTRVAAAGPQTFSIVTRAPDESPGGPGLPPGGPEIPPEPPEDGDDRDTPVEPVPRRLTVTAVSLDRATVTVGESVSATATVSNDGSERVEEVLGMAVNGVVLDDRLVSVAPGEERTVTFTWRVPREGAYVTSIGGVETPPVTAGPPTAPAFGVFELASPLAVAVTPPAALALIVFGSLAKRRRS